MPDFTYAGNPSESDVDAVRFLIGDTDMSEPLLSNEEIIFLSSQWTMQHSIYWTAAVAAETIAARFAREVTFNSDSQSISTSELQQKYQSLAERMRTLHRSYVIGGMPDVGGMLKGEGVDPTVAPLAFGRGMHDEPEAGQQDFGSIRKSPYGGHYDPLLGH